MEGKAKYTPGPWIREGTFVYALAPEPEFPKNQINRFSASVSYDNRRAFPGIESELEANACLIAAAPDLLEALKYAEEHDGEHFEDIRQRIRELRRAAIAKAEGLT